MARYLDDSARIRDLAKLLGWELIGSVDIDDYDTSEYSDEPGAHQHAVKALTNDWLAYSAPASPQLVDQFAKDGYRLTVSYGKSHDGYYSDVITHWVLMERGRNDFISSYWLARVGEFGNESLSSNRRWLMGSLTDQLTDV